MALRALQGPTGGGAPVGGSGTSSPSTIPRWTGPSTLGNSGLIDDGTQVYTTTRNFGIGTPSPGALLHLSSAATTLRVSSTTATNAALVRIEAGGGNVYVGRDSSAGTVSGVASSSCFIDSLANPIVLGTSSSERMRISGSAAQVAIGTGSFTSGRALTTVADLDVFGVRVGRGPGDIASNTAIGAGALSSCSTGSENTVLGQNAGFGILTGVRNVMIGVATGSGGTVTGSRNIVVGRQAGNQLTSGSDNVLLGTQAGDSITTGSSNIVIGCGAGADVAAATDSNKLVIGDATNYVATNGGATTYYATAGALAGYIIVRLNGTDVKLPVYAL